MSVSFESHRPFIDKKNFPYGFARSGIFTNKLSLIIEKHGVAYKELAEGTRSAKTAEEEHFLAFCRGEEPAQNDHEKAWQTYLSQIGRKVTYYSMDIGRSKHAAVDIDESFDDSDSDAA